MAIIQSSPVRTVAASRLTVPTPAALDNKVLMDRVLAGAVVAAPKKVQADPPEDSPVTISSLVPAWLRALAMVLSGLLAGAYGFTPHPWSTAVGILALVSALLAGVSMPSIRFTKPVLPLTLVPLCLLASDGLVAFASSLTNNLAQSGVMLLAIILSALAGKTLPPPLSAKLK